MPFPSLAKVKRYFIYWFEGTNAIFSPGPAGLSFSNRRSHSNSEPLLTLAIRLKVGAKQPPGASWAPPVAQPGNMVCPRAPPTAASLQIAVRPALRSRRLFYLDRRQMHLCARMARTCPRKTKSMICSSKSPGASWVAPVALLPENGPQTPRSDSKTE